MLATWRYSGGWFGATNPARLESPCEVTHTAAMPLLVYSPPQHRPRSKEEDAMRIRKRTGASAKRRSGGGMLLAAGTGASAKRRSGGGLLLAAGTGASAKRRSGGGVLLAAALVIAAGFGGS